MRVNSISRLAFLLLFFSHSINGQTVDWRSKISPTVFQKAAAGESVDFLVFLHEQADVSQARFLLKKEEKGAFVFQQLTETAQRAQGRVLETVWSFQAPHQSFWIVNAVWAEGGMALIEALARLPEVKEIQFNPKVQMEEPEQSGLRAVTWGIEDIGADEVWAMGYKGQNVVVGGQDTGYDWDHPAIKSKYRGWNATTMMADHNYNWHDAIHTNAGMNDCGVNSPEPCDDDNHGTHTMGTMTGHNTTDSFGVAPSAKWIGCRNMDEGAGTPTTYLECFEWFLAPTDLNDDNPNPALAPHVINNSWSCPPSEGCNTGNFATMETAINNLRMAGVVVVVSAGNSGSSCSTVNAPPAIFDGSFSVGATNSSDTIANFSSRGPVTVDGSNRLKPNVSAPGVGVYSCIRNGQYATFSGTSMAGPHVAGTVALMISANSSLSGQVEQIETILEATARGKTSTQTCGSVPGTNIPNNTFGYGIIDALEAVSQSLILLPVELFSFTGRLVGMDVVLFWETSAGSDLNHFEVEHSSDGNSWQTIGQVIYSSAPQNGHYQFLHANPGAGIHYYRLRLVDIDESFEYSGIVVVQMPGEKHVMLFPNPVSGELSIVAKTGSNQEVLIRIYDAAGKLAASVEQLPEKGMISQSFEVSDWPSGVYFVKILERDGSGLPLQEKFFKK